MKKNVKNNSTANSSKINVEHKRKKSSGTYSYNINKNNNNNNLINNSSISQKVNSMNQIFYNGLDDETEEIDIKIPTPYPKTKYFTIDDPSLVNSNYTTILNEKYPPRKYLLHNQDSFNKINKDKITEIKFNFLNPKLNFSDYNLKELTFKGEEIDESKIKKLEDALEIISSLKAKLIEYELANNQNINKAKDIINNLEEQNTLYLNKINELYDEIERIEKKYGIDFEHPNPNDPLNILIKEFRNRWLKKTFMKNFKNRILRQKKIKKGYKNLELKRNVLLKLKTFIAFEKLQNINAFKMAIINRRGIKLISNAIDTLRKNLVLNKLQKKFYYVQQNLYQLIYIKELKLKIYQKKRYKNNNKKALFFYYFKTVKKIMQILKTYAIHKDEIENIKIKKSNKNNNKIAYLNFIKHINENYKGNIPSNLKENKVKGLKCLKNIFNKIEEKNEENNMINNKRLLTLNKYFNLWKKGQSEMDKIMYIKILHQKNLINSFFKSALNSYKFHKYSMEKDNIKSRQNLINRFFKNSLKKIRLKKKIKEFKEKLPKIQMSLVLKKILNLAQIDPFSRFASLRKKLIYSYTLEKLKDNKNNSIEKSHSKNKNKIFQSLYPKIFYKQFLVKIKHQISNFKNKKERINKLIHSHYLSKSFKILLIKAYKKKEKKIRDYYENTISYIKKILNEKSIAINKLQYDNNDLIKNYQNLLSQIQMLSNENEQLKRRINEINTNYISEKKAYNDALRRNKYDIQKMDDNMKNVQNQLHEALQREDLLQQKYCNEIQNSIQLNKNLNEIINRKNQEIYELNSQNEKLENKKNMNNILSNNFNNNYNSFNSTNQSTKIGISKSNF